MVAHPLPRDVGHRIQLRRPAGQVEHLHPLAGHSAGASCTKAQAGCAACGLSEQLFVDIGAHAGADVSTHLGRERALRCPGRKHRSDDLFRLAGPRLGTLFAAHNRGDSGQPLGFGSEWERVKGRFGFPAEGMTPAAKPELTRVGAAPVGCGGRQARAITRQKVALVSPWARWGVHTQRLSAVEVAVLGQGQRGEGAALRPQRRRLNLGTAGRLGRISHRRQVDFPVRLVGAGLGTRHHQPEQGHRAQMLSRTEMPCHCSKGWPSVASVPWKA